MDVWQARYYTVDGFSQCLTDVNAVLDSAHWALTDHGEWLEIDRLPRIADDKVDVGNRKIVAITDTNPLRFSYAAASNPISGLGPNQTTQSVTLTEPNYVTPSAWAARYVVDSTNTVVEFNENDNAKGECKMIR